MSSKYSNKINLITVPQSVTDDWVDLGPTIYMDGYHRIIVYPEIDINDSLNIRLRALEKHSQTGTGFVETIENVSSAVVKVKEAYLELDVDVSQNLRMEFESHPISHFQLQIKAGTVGASAAEIVSCKYCLRKFIDD